MREKIKEEFLFDRLKNIDKPIYLYGMGNGAQKMLDVLARYGLSAAGIFASDEYVRGHSFLGFTVKRYSELPTDCVILSAFGVQLPEMRQRFVEIAKTHEFYAPELPLFGELVLFDERYLNNNLQKIEKAYALLADAQSRKVFLNTIEHRLSGKIDYLIQMESEKAEIYQALLRVNQQEVYLDLGAYDGDTVRELLHYTGGKANKIIALEPDPKNFKKLVAKSEGIVALNKGVYNSEGTVSFSTEASRNSSVTAKGSRQIEVTTIDKLCEQLDVTLIKLDVEGCEQAALQGARQTLQQKKPRLIVAAYRKTGDFFELLLQLHELNPAYQLYLRHQPYIPNWETNIIAL